MPSLIYIIWLCHFEIKRNSHIKIREKNRLLTYMHGRNFNEMLETKENILRLTYIVKINRP